MNTHPVPVLSSKNLNVRTCAPVVRQIASSRVQFRCPACRSIVYTRRHKLCGICGQELPPQILFTSTESFRLQSLMRAEKEKHRAWMKRAS